MKNFINTLVSKNQLVNDHPVSVKSKVFLKVDKKVYVHDTESNRAYLYTLNADNQVSGFTQITLCKYNTACDAYKKRLEAANVEKWRREHNEQAQKVRHTETNKTEPDAFPTMGEIPIRREERWNGTPDKNFIWPVGSFITVRMIEEAFDKDGKKIATRNDEGRIIADAFLLDGAYRFQFEEVRSVDGKAVPTGKKAWFAIPADQKTVDNFKRAVDKRYDNYLWKKLNQGVEYRYKCQPVTVIDLSVFFEYLVKFPIKALYDYTEWVDQNTNEPRRSKNPKVRLWLPGDFDNDNRQYHNTATR